MMALKTFLSLVACALLAIPVSAQTSEAPAPPADLSTPLGLLRQLDRGFVEVFKKVAPSVVVISTTKKNSGDDAETFDFFFRLPDEDSQGPFKMPERDNRSEGSGFIIREDGYILTNNHVIDGADTITVKLKDGRRFPGSIVGVDSRTDIAIIRIKETGLPTAAFGDSEALEIGQIVCAIGVPFALDYSFTIGCVSGKGRANLSQHVTYEDYIQTDAFINPGNSGGPLFDVEGRVVGMNTLINGIGRGLAFAIPSNMLKQVSDELIATGKVRRPWLGIRIETLEPDSTLREQIKGIDHGVLINTIEPEAPAYKSDLRPADVITAVDGRPVKTALELQKAILHKKVGQEIALTIWRNGKSLEIPITTGELPAQDRVASSSSTPAAPPAAKGQPDAAAADVDRLYGLEYANLDDATAKRLGVAPGAGVVVTAVAPESPAEVAKIEVDDVIREIDSQPVKDAASMRQELEKHDSKKALLLFLERKGQKTYAVLKV
ncbi:MAG TPA: trypsin-like peptidase domain-containing protein [Chthoniobacteraceae bacterium]|nr:trypsin-like peptidase domain-containing protein [Chthoniobacteraceae bacterium]